MEKKKVILRTDEELSILTGLNVENLREFREIFRLVDSHGNGIINYEDLKHLVFMLNREQAITYTDANFLSIVRQIKRLTTDEMTEAFGYNIKHETFSVKLITKKKHI